MNPLIQLLIILRAPLSATNSVALRSNSVLLPYGTRVNKHHPQILVSVSKGHREGGFWESLAYLILICFMVPSAPCFLAVAHSGSAQPLYAMFPVCCVGQCWRFWGPGRASLAPISGREEVLRTTAYLGNPTLLQESFLDNAQGFLPITRGPQ